MAPDAKTRVTFVVTHPMTARHLLRGQLRHLSEGGSNPGFEVTLVTSPGAELDGVANREGVRVETVPMAREIAPLADLRSLFRLTRLLRQLRPEIVNAGTPKAGLLGMLAARRAGVPRRVYTLRGLRLETARGFRRRLLTFTERLACRCAHRVVCVSESLRRRAVELGLVPEAKLQVLGAGSSNGVDVDRFAAAAADGERTEALRRELGIASLTQPARVIGFVGRFVRDKGIEDLAAAFHRIVRDRPDTRLLLLGDFEPGDPVPAGLAERLRSDPRVLMPGFVPEAAPYYPLMDVLAFPSSREGFPNAPLEAAAAGVPTVGYRVTGTVDAVVDGVTGRIVPPGDRAALVEALATYLDDPELAVEHGRAARERAETLFRREIVWREWERFFRELTVEPASGRTESE